VHHLRGIHHRPATVGDDHVGPGLQVDRHPGADLGGAGVRFHTRERRHPLTEPVDHLPVHPGGGQEVVGHQENRPPAELVERLQCLRAQPHPGGQPELPHALPLFSCVSVLLPLTAGIVSRGSSGASHPGFPASLAARIIQRRR